MISSKKIYQVNKELKLSVLITCIVYMFVVTHLGGKYGMIVVSCGAALALRFRMFKLAELTEAF